MRSCKTIRIPSVSFASAGAGGVVVGHKPSADTATNRQGRAESRAPRPAMAGRRRVGATADRVGKSA
jgi:hypothetical protein